jgi:hypothetical protein
MYKVALELPLLLCAAGRNVGSCKYRKGRMHLDAQLTLLASSELLQKYFTSLTMSSSPHSYNYVLLYTPREVPGEIEESFSDP